MADKELARIRCKFVDNVSPAVLKQLLDDLLDDGVLNDGEKDSIIEEKSSRADRARDLADIIKRKGVEASRKMIGHLQDRDPALCSNLGLSCAQLTQPKSQDCSTEAFWRDKINDNSVYPVTTNAIRNRMALLITNIKFADEQLNRRGAEKDEENMEKLLTFLGYEVVKHTNLTAKEIDKALADFSKLQKLKETDSVLVVIMSHGKLGAVLGVNWKHGDEKPDEFPINNIYTHLASQNCPALLNKPKIIIIQACRGEEKGSVLVSDRASADVVCDEAPQPGPSASTGKVDIECDTLQCVHKEKDFISLLSCTPDTVSYRKPDCGCFLIQYIVDVFNSFADKDDVEELFRKVMQRFEDFAVCNKRQMPTKDRCTLTKRFYFFPDKELSKARSKFVETVSKEVLKQLLDDLLEDSVLNDGEKDSILEDNSSRADRARCLADIVKKKGDRASRKMIAGIKCRDPELYSQLFPSQPAPPEPTEKKIRLSPARVKPNDNSIYPVTENSLRNRVALIISNTVFTDKKLNRHGGEKDEENMEKQLTSMGYEVVKHTNLTAKEIDDAVIKFSKHPKLKETDSMFVVIMSHGKLGAVLGVNWKHGDKNPDEFPINNIYTHLASQNCPALLNKPKIIIIQACRGEEEGSVLVSDSVVSDDVRQPPPSHPASELDIEDDSLRCVHKEKDFISLLSSTPDTVAYRHKEHGSFLIQYMVEVFNAFSREDDIEELFRKVMQRFEDFSNRDARQMPTKDRCTLTKRFYLFHGQPVLPP